jgi:signal peptidase I
MIKKRNPLVAFLLSLVPGLGQIYNGQPKKAVIFLIIDLLIPIAFGLGELLYKINGLIILMVISISFILYRMIDGIIQARKLINYELRLYNKWYFYLSFFILVMIIRIPLDFQASTGIQTFNIPTPSMHPTIQPKDKIVTSLKYYDSHQIQQGDIVIFNSPKGGIWVFRVIGLPNDSIEIKEGKVYINNYLSDLTPANEYILDNQEIVEYEESLNQNKKIRTLRFKNISLTSSQTFEKIKVPDNEYFLMGDNRDNAYDSRFIGTIKREDILGRVLYTYWGATSDRVNIDLRN